MDKKIIEYYPELPDEVFIRDNKHLWKNDKIDVIDVPENLYNYIYIPQKIIASNLELIDFIPVYQVTRISENRKWKYNDSNFEKKIHIKQVNTIRSFFTKYKTYPIYDINSTIEGVSVFPEFFRDITNEKKREASKISDRDIDDGMSILSYLTYNLLDFIPRLTKYGYYDAYMTEKKLKSNHVVFELVKK